MAKQKVIICDICGKQFEPNFYKRAKLSVNNKDLMWYDSIWKEIGWTKFDLCPTCTDYLISTVRNMTRGDIND